MTPDETRVAIYCAETIARYAADLAVARERLIDAEDALSDARRKIGTICTRLNDLSEQLPSRDGTRRE
jgi:hypothetical protein